MKRQFILGMVSTLVLSSALAAGPAKNVRSYTESLTRAASVNETARLDSRNQVSTVDALAKNNDVEPKELTSALGKTMTIDVNGEKKQVSMISLALTAKLVREQAEVIRDEIRIGSVKDEALSAKVTAQENGVKLVSKLMAMSSAEIVEPGAGNKRVAAKIKSGMSAQQAVAEAKSEIKRDNDLFNKFMSEYTNVLVTGTAREIESYNAKAQAISDARTSANVSKDEALNSALSEAKKKELEGCKRG